MQLIFLKVLKICESNSTNSNNPPHENQINQSFSIHKLKEDNIGLSEESQKEINDLLNNFENSISFLIESNIIREACIYLNFFLDLIRDYPIIFEHDVVQTISLKLHETKKLL